MTVDFIPGLDLSRCFYEEAVRPVLEEVFPELTYSAARIGGGSEVLGFDTERSTDHEWGPRLQLFLSGGDVRTYAEPVSAALSDRLPKEFRGWSTHFGPEDAEVRTMEPTSGPVRHRVDVTGVSAWSIERLGFDAAVEVTVLDWLTTPGQRLAETVGGAVFHDGLGELQLLRERLGWYPDDVWRYLLGCQWQRIAQEEAFPGRCAEVGDELGARIVTTRLVRDLMRLILLMQRRYVPYSKWLGSAFAAQPGNAAEGAALQQALTAMTWQEREQHLGRAYEMIAARHNDLGLTPSLNVSTGDYHARPYKVIDAGRFSTALLETISDARIRDLPPVGNVDQFIDSTEVLSYPARARAAGQALLKNL
jgi:Domain of unknown function (DUF4037)